MMPGIWAVERNMYSNRSPTTGNPGCQRMDHSLRIQAKAKLKRDCGLLIFSPLQEGKSAQRVCDTGSDGQSTVSLPSLHQP